MPPLTAAGNTPFHQLEVGGLLTQYAVLEVGEWQLALQYGKSLVWSLVPISLSASDRMCPRQRNDRSSMAQRAAAVFSRWHWHTSTQPAGLSIMAQSCHQHTSGLADSRHCLLSQEELITKCRATLKVRTLGGRLRWFKGINDRTTKGATSVCPPSAPAHTDDRASSPRMLCVPWPSVSPAPHLDPDMGLTQTNPLFHLRP